MGDECNVMLVHSRKRRSEKAKLRDQIELQKCQIENLERENECLKAVLASHNIPWNGVPDIIE